MGKFRVGETVRVNKLGKPGVVSEVSSGQRYRVSIGSLSMVSTEGDLSEVETSKKRKNTSERTKGSKVSDSSVRISSSARASPQQLDLHGMTVSDAIHAVEEWLNRVLLSGAERATIVHGLGTGTLQRAVHEYLRGIPSVARFSINDRNAGQTDLFF